MNLEVRGFCPLLAQGLVLVSESKLLLRHRLDYVSDRGHYTLTCHENRTMQVKLLTIVTESKKRFRV